MRFGKWMSKILFSMVMLKKRFIWNNLRVLNMRIVSKCASLKDPFMV